MGVTVFGQCGLQASQLDLELLEFVFNSSEAMMQGLRPLLLCRMIGQGRVFMQLLGQSAHRLVDVLMHVGFCWKDKDSQARRG